MIKSKVAVILLLILSIISSGISFEPFVLAPISTLSNPPANGDWIVTDSTEINDTALILNGNLTITNSGSLNLTNVTLIMNGNITVDGRFILRNVTVIMNITKINNITKGNGRYNIVVEPDGLMYILDYDADPATDDGSLITNIIPDGFHRYTFWVKSGSKFKMENSELRECGYGSLFPGYKNDYTKGLSIDTNYAQIKNCTINYAENGILFNSSNAHHNYIFNTTFTRGTSYRTLYYGMYGLTFIHSTNNIVENCTFKDLIFGLFLYYSHNNSIIGCNFSDSVKLIESGRSSFGISSEYSNDNTICDSRLDLIAFGIFLTFSSKTTIKNATLNGTYMGISIETYCYWINLFDINITNVQNPNPEPNELMGAGVYLYSTNKHIKMINLSIDGNNNYFCYGIWWDSPAYSKDFIINNCTITNFEIAIDVAPYFGAVSGSVNEVLVTNSFFEGNNYGIRFVHQITNWVISNSTIKKSTGQSYPAYELFVIGLFNNVNNFVIKNSQIITNDTENRVNGVMVANYYGNLIFEIAFEDSRIDNMSYNGFSLSRQGNIIGGSIDLDNCSVTGNTKDGIYSNYLDLDCKFNNSNFSSNRNYGLNLLSLTSSDIFITNSTISNNDHYGISIQNTESDSRINIKNSSVNENGITGLSVKNSGTKININNSDFMRNKQSGINIVECPIDIFNSNISSNKGAGINVKSSTGNIFNNVFLGNGREGVLLNGSNNNIDIVNNHFLSNGVISSSPELYLINSQNIEIINNDFKTLPEYSTVIALKLENSNNVGISENIFCGGYTESVVDIDNSDVFFMQNQIIACGPIARGIYCYNYGTVTISNNNLKASGKYGILISGLKTAIINDNTISHWIFGITISNLTTILNGNYIQNSSYCGIQIKSNTYATLENNFFIENKNAIIIHGTGNIKNNHILGSDDNGLWIIGSGMGIINKNQIKNNGKGVLVDHGVCISNENAFRNNGYGLYLVNAKDSTFYMDSIIENDIGLYAENSIFNTSKYLFQNNNQTMILFNSKCIILNSTIEDLISKFKLQQQSLCNILNSESDTIEADIVDNGSLLEKQWFLNITVVNTAKDAISNANVQILNRADIVVYTGQTSTSGRINKINLTSMSWLKSGEYNPNPFKVIISKKNYGTTLNYLNFTENMNVTFIAYKLSEIITNVTAMDVPNDQGGAILLSWDSIKILNFHHYNIYEDNEYITSASYLTSIIDPISDQETRSIIITNLNGHTIQNGVEYYFAITVVDSDGNEDWHDVVSSNQVIALDNLAPEPVRNLSAFDSPNDNGGSITVAWEPAMEPDFKYYALYCLTENITDEINISKLPIKEIINNNELNSIEIFDLFDNTDYYIFILVYDLNGNVNTSFRVIGPIRAFDNISPRINRDNLEPSNKQSLTFETTARQVFRVFLSSGVDVEYNWYLDGEELKNVSDSYVFLSMSDYDLGYHNLTIFVSEPSGLNDSVSWNFSIESVPIIPGGNGVDDETDYWWIILIIVVFVIIVLFSFTYNYTHRYTTVRKTLKTLPSLDDSQTISLIKTKMEQGDRYTLIKLSEELPRVLDTKPDKLFFILSLLIQDETKEIRNMAASNIAVLLDNNPHNAFTWLHRLKTNNVDPDTYHMISQATSTQIINDLFKGFHALITAQSEDEYRWSLEEFCTVLKGAEGLKFGLELSMMYSALNDFYKYRTIAKISTSRPILDKILNLRTWAPEFLYADAFEVYGKMTTLAESLGKYEKIEGVEDKLSYLSLSLNLLEDASRISREKLFAPERDIFSLVLTSWRNIISVSLRDLRGRADLGLNLIGKEMMADQDKITLMLELENKGRSIAERVLVELVPSNDYIVLSPPQELGGIGHLKKKVVTFELRPRATDAFRVEFTVHYDDAEKREKSISFGDLVSFVNYTDEFMEIPNPYIVGTPIKTGSKLFVGRRDLIDFIQKNIRGSLQENIIILIGHRRTGKTTILKQLPIYLSKEYVPVYIDIQGIIDPGMDAFFYLLAIEIVTAMKSRGYEIASPVFEDFKERPSFHFEYEFLKDVYEKLGDSILIMMFDEFEELEVKVDSGILDKNIFSYLRHLMQHTRQLAFIFTGSFRLEDLKTDYWSIMFNIAIYKRVTFLSEAETKELITEPVKDYNMVFDPLALEKIYRLTHGHPYFTQLLCHALVNTHNSEKKNYITIQEVDRELNRILERGQMHFDFIWDRSSRLERLVMTALSRVLDDEETATVSSLVNKLAEYNLSVSPKDISKTLDILANKDIVAKILNHTTKYEFKVDLIRIWLLNTKQLDQVVENYRASN